MVYKCAIIGEVSSKQIVLKEWERISMHKKALLACMLVVTMLLSGCALIEKDEAVDRATEIVRVGDTVYTKGEILDQVNYQLSYMSYVYQMYGMSYDTTDAQNISDAKDAVINSLVEDAVKNIKVKELGLDTLTDEETATLKENTDEAWESNRTSVKNNYFAETELTGDELEKAIDAKCEELGVSRQTVEDSQRTTLTQDKLRQYVIKDVTVSEEELQTAYDAKVEEAKTSYASDLSAYGTAVNADNTVYYRPAGYRMVKQILVKFLAEDQTVIDGINSAISTRTSNISTLTTNLTNLGVTDVDALVAQVTVSLEQPAATEGLSTPTDLATVTDVTAAFGEDTTEDVADVAKQLASAKAEKTFLEGQLETAKKNAFAHIDAAADDILAQLASGADWDTLMAEKTEDPGMQGDAATAKRGYAVCENFSGFDTAFTTAAMALAKVGDVSPKTEGSYGYYIIQYTSDVEEGAVALDDVREELSASTLTEKQDTTYEDTLAAWVEAANAKINRSALDD